MFKAYILKRSAYRETSYLLDVFTEEFGIISLIFKGAKNNKNSAKSQIVNLFNQVSIDFDHKKKSLTYIKSYEIIKPVNLFGIYLYCGFYLNEVLLKLLHKHDSYENLFHYYDFLIDAFNFAQVESNKKIQCLIRYFEIHLLKEIGLGFDFEFDMSRQKIDKNKNYQLDFENGFIQTTQNNQSNQFINGLVLNQLSQLSLKKVQEINGNELEHNEKNALLLLRKMVDFSNPGKQIESREMIKEYLNL